MNILGRLAPNALCVVALILFLAPAARGRVWGARAQEGAALVPRFEMRASGLRLERRTHPGAFFDVLGRRAAVFGYEHRPLEAWVYPLQILDQFELSFRLEGYPHEFRASDTSALIEVRPEATTITHTHAAFTVRQIVFAPLDEAGVVILLDVDSALPLTVVARFRPRLRPMWPAGASTPNVAWDERERAFFITEETRRFVGVVGSPVARGEPALPYQEEPRDAPAQFTLEVSPDELKSNFIPIVIAGGVRGREDALASYRKLLGSARELFEANVHHYRRLLSEATSVETPDARVNEAFEWAKVGVDKGVVENPMLGRGLVAGFRTAGESERPGFAWFFGRDALWTVLALNSYGDFETTRYALGFLKKFQRADGKIPHEISQSAALVPWFSDYPYPWASADATPLYVVAHADYLRASGDINFTRANWDSIVKAFRFTAATDTDGNGLIENTAVGHGWVEGGALYPPHEEIYMQGVWAEALSSLEEMALLLDDERLASQAREAAERAEDAIERTFWLEARGFYAFATNRPRESPRKAEPGPNLEARQSRMNELDRSKLVDEDTVLPAVPLWWGVLDPSRAQEQIDHLGSARVATDWGSRIISDESRLYDPLSYHHGSVWPLFTGWTSVGAYRYGRPHVGFQALMSNVLLRRQWALGYVTELLSGERNAPFGRSSHHQVWSEAMTVAPVVRGLLGVEVEEAGSLVRFAPQLPADWNSLEVRRVAAADRRLDFSLRRAQGRMMVVVRAVETLKRAGETVVEFAPAFPLDARVRSVRVNGRAVDFEVTTEGDIRRAEFSFTLRERAEVVITYDPGTDVYVSHDAPRPGARSEALHILRSRAEDSSLHLLLEGRGRRSYTMHVRTPFDIGRDEGDEGGPFVARRTSPDEYEVTVAFDSTDDAYVRRELVIPLRPRATNTRAAAAGGRVVR